MKISTSPNIMLRFVGNSVPDYDYSTIEQLSTLHSVGFRCFDFNFVDYVRGENAPLRADDWENWLAGVADFATRNDLEFFQAHGHMFEQNQQHVFGIDEAESIKCIERSIFGAKMLGVKWLVWHAYDSPEHLDDTWSIFDKIHEMCLRNNVGMAVENTPFGVCQDAEGLKLVLDHYGNENIGVCWDTGHANLNHSINQTDEIRKLGTQLKVLHVSDNAGRGDDHLAPFYGNIDWRSVIRALKDAGYAGTFNFETHNFVNRLPVMLQLQSIMLMYRIGEHLTNEFNRL